MPSLVLIKHSLPEVVPGTAPSAWELGPEGRRRAWGLVPLLGSYAPEAVYSSTEPKALQTAGVISEGLGAEVRPLDGLREHRRDAEPFEPEERFRARVRAMFEKPHELVYGEETAAAALARFRASIDGIAAGAGGSDIVAVSHGTVISLFVASVNEIDAFGLWERLGLPSLVLLEIPRFALTRVIDRTGSS